MHDFKNFPELTNSQMQVYYFDSPHKQILESFRAEVVKVIDGDTVRLRCDFRDFDFPLRFLNIQAPELKDVGGRESQKWMEKMLYHQEVDVIVIPENRVEKWGRLLGYVQIHGLDVGEESMLRGHSIAWEARNDGKIQDFKKGLEHNI